MKHIALLTESTHEAPRTFDLAPDFIVVDPQIIELLLLWPLCPQMKSQVTNSASDVVDIACTDFGLGEKTTGEAK